MIYLDNAATTPVCAAALDAFADACGVFGNPSSGHALGRAAQQLLTQSRQTIAEVLGVAPNELLLTGGGTESINTALQGAVKPGGHVVTSALEHPATRKTLDHLRHTHNINVTTLNPDPSGQITADAVTAAMRPETCLVTLTEVASETGATADIAAIGAAVKQKNQQTLMHIDGVQGFLKITRFLPKNIDFYSFSGHKFHAPKGIGGLVCRAAPRPLLFGGGQQNHLRPGTEPLPLIAALAAAVVAFREIDPALTALLTATCAALPCVTLIPGHSHIVSLSQRKFPGEVLMRIASDKGLCIGTGSACSKGQKSPLRNWLAPPLRDGVVRLSLGAHTTREDIAKGGETLQTILAQT